MQSPFFPFFQRQGWVLLDGALATELERRGADLRDPLWSARLLLEQPELIRQVHYDYYVAGADVVVTASYQASFEGFARRGLSPAQASAAFRLSVKLAKEAREQFWKAARNRRRRLRPLVAASVGPYGAFLADGSEYRGDYGLTVEELMDWHRPRMAVLADSGADLLACETIPCLAEGEALVRLLPEFPDVKAWLSFSCRDGARLCHGEFFSAAASLVESAPQIVAFGVNCTPPRYIESLLRSAAGYSSKPLLAYPNSGETWDAARHCWIETGGHTDFAPLARRWYEAGARLLGGCCRTLPEDVKAMRRALET